eukprot:1159070-Pelagomonas_calceolata.AAC.12
MFHAQFPLNQALHVCAPAAVSTLLFPDEHVLSLRVLVNLKASLRNHSDSELISAIHPEAESNDISTSLTCVTEAKTRDAQCNKSCTLSTLHAFQQTSLGRSLEVREGKMDPLRSLSLHFVLLRELFKRFKDEERLKGWLEALSRLAGLPSAPPHL